MWRSAISPPGWVPLRSQASGAGCGRRRAPTYTGTAGARVAARRRPAHTRPQRPRLRQRGQRLGVREQRQRRRRRRRGRGRGRDALPGPSGPVEEQLEGGGPRRAEQRAPEPWPHFREGGRDLPLGARRRAGAGRASVTSPGPPRVSRANGLAPWRP
ncbi:voltage-dependent P/Q-type calcium channel subunit alpha-1A-like [Peromyscus leucopus]|uniref:voltage-dependent P/Q-type calcium channel subunit alpha-1A-like n=1 Tax=Peromyscus leucopus TaxID=10041 RepID=UPI0018854FA3|nr:voltage-dependent P/Q-type calcium channel subunit alpha-1A-like [Peromyscus leucopus]